MLATPAVRRIAQEYAVQLADVRGSGKEGRVLKEDILAHVAGSAPAPLATFSPPSHAPSPAGKAAPAPAAPLPPRPAPVVLGKDRVEKSSVMVKAMTKTMVEALKIPHFGYKDEVSQKVVSPAWPRAPGGPDPARQAESGPEGGLSGAWHQAVLHAFHCQGLFHGAPSLPHPKQYNRCGGNPPPSSYLLTQAETITYKAAHNIALAMDTPAGLLVPNIKAVQGLSVFEIAVELNRLQQLGAAGKLGTSDLGGGTFSLSNIGSVGGTYAKPVILPPQVNYLL